MLKNLSQDEFRRLELRNYSISNYFYIFNSNYSNNIFSRLEGREIYEARIDILKRNVHVNPRILQNVYSYDKPKTEAPRRLSIHVYQGWQTESLEEEVFYGCFTRNSVSVLVVYSRTKLRVKHV